MLEQKTLKNDTFQQLPSVDNLTSNGIDEAKKNKVILQTLVKTKQNLEMQNQIMNKQNDRLSLRLEVCEEKLQEKEESLLKVIQYISKIELSNQNSQAVS